MRKEGNRRKEDTPCYIALSQSKEGHRNIKSIQHHRSEVFVRDLRSCVFCA